VVYLQTEAAHSGVLRMAMELRAFKFVIVR
jgi:hypothetical protein